MIPRARTIALAVALFVPTATDARAFVPPKHPAIADREPLHADWSGRWRTDYGILVLTASHGGEVTGSYSYGTPPVLGRLEGVAEGRRLSFEWREPSGAGRAIFDLTEDGTSFTGRWGSGASPDDGGAWNGSRD